MNEVSQQRINKHAQIQLPYLPGGNAMAFKKKK